MVVFEIDVFIFVLYLNESIIFYKVYFDEVLWERILGEVMELYDKYGIVKYIRSRLQLKLFKEFLFFFVKINVEFLCEVLLFYMIDSMLLVRFILSFFFNKVCLVDRVERECF